ncbi:protein NATD1 [Drosophila obscura]|uniref:protein NATD1 n=1 Tax=Drosophila obscura TaxID=7282 RepID=UPI000BA14E01|nr:protein NATD1 [Drosophila obscura]XP_022233211.1 protein NATD1 [Drosophila obscura]
MLSKIRTLNKFCLINGLSFHSGHRTYSLMRTKLCFTYVNSVIQNSLVLKACKMYRPERFMSMKISIQQDQKSFFIYLDGMKAELGYFIRDGVMQIDHTKVPTKLGGHGLGKLLAKAALEYALRNGLFIIIHCDFVKYYVEKYEPHYSKYILK